MNRHVKILAWIHLAPSGILLGIGIILLIGSALDRSEYPTALPYIAGFFFWFGVVLLVPSFIGGFGLLRNKRWARVLLIVVSVEFLFSFPVGTVLGGYGLWALLNR